MTSNAANPTSGPTLLILAAGLGSRFGGWKQIEPVGPSGEIILDYAVYDALRTGFGRVVFIVREEIEKPLRTRFDKPLAGRMETVYVRQELTDLPCGFTAPLDRRKPWGTAHAVWTARNALDRPFAVINADDFYGRTSFERLSGFLQSVDVEAQRTPVDFAMVGFLLRNTLSPHGTVSRGICSVSPVGFLESIIERTKIRPEGRDAAYLEDGQWQPVSGDAVASMNMWGLTPAALPWLEEYVRRFLEHSGRDPSAECYLPMFMADILERGLCRVRVLDTPDRWVGVTYSADLDEARTHLARLVQDGVYPSPLWPAE